MDETLESRVSALQEQISDLELHVNTLIEENQSNKLKADKLRTALLGLLSNPASISADPEVCQAVRTVLA